MKKFTLCLLGIFIWALGNFGCSLMQGVKDKDETFELPSYVPGYYAIDPIVIANVENQADNQNPDPDLLYLYKVGSKSTQFIISGSGEIKYLSSGIEAKSNKYNVTVDHLVYSPVELMLTFRNVNGSNKTFPVGLVLGVSIRIKGRATSGEGTFNLSDVPGLGVATAVNASGANVEIEVIGIRNSTILKLPRYIGDLNASTLQTLIQNISTINAEVDGDNTEIVPQIIGVDIKSLPKGVEIFDVVSALRAWKTTRVKAGQSIELNDLLRASLNFTYEWQRSAEVVEEGRQQRVDRLLDAIIKLSDKDAISLAVSPPVQDSRTKMIVNSRDPSKRRATDPDVAKEILKMMIVLGQRDDRSLDAWEAAVISTQ